MEQSKLLVSAGWLLGAATLIVVVILIALIARHRPRAAVIAAILVVIAVLMALYAYLHPHAATSGDPQADEEAALKAAEPIDPSMIGYHEAGTFSVAFHEPRALAVDSDARIYVGGDRAVIRYSSDGKKLAEIALRGEPRCLAVGAFNHVKPGQLYVGMDEHVEVFDPNGTRLAVWKSAGAKAIFTSITTTEEEVWVADAGNRLVWHFDTTGRPLEPLGRPDPAKQRPGFLVTSHYFDVAAGTDDLIYVVNPRLLHVEGYTRNGDYETVWGQGSSSVADFFGCCNPAQLAVLPDGGFVTAEKGIPRVKTYSRVGRLQSVVAGPAQLSDTPANLAADRHGRVLVLDSRAAKVRVFEKNPSNKGKP